MKEKKNQNQDEQKEKETETQWQGKEKEPKIITCKGKENQNLSQLKAKLSSFKDFSHDEPMIMILKPHHQANIFLQM